MPIYKGKVRCFWNQNQKNQTNNHLLISARTARMLLNAVAFNHQPWIHKPRRLLNWGDHLSIILSIILSLFGSIWRVPPIFLKKLIVTMVNENPGLPPGRPGRLRLWYRAGFQKSSGRFQQILQDGTILVKCMAKWLNNKTISSYLGTWSMIFPMSHLDPFGWLYPLFRGTYDIILYDNGLHSHYPIGKVNG